MYIILCVCIHASFVRMCTCIHVHREEVYMSELALKHELENCTRVMNVLPFQ